MNKKPERTGNADRRSAVSDGWVVWGETVEIETRSIMRFRTPPAPHTFPKDIAERMAIEMKDRHPEWEWAAVPPNTEVSDAGRSRNRNTEGDTRHSLD